jgi:hypothetical protein
VSRWDLAETWFVRPNILKRLRLLPGAGQLWHRTARHEADSELYCWTLAFLVFAPHFMQPLYKKPFVANTLVFQERKGCDGKTWPLVGEDDARRGSPRGADVSEGGTEKINEIFSNGRLKTKQTRNPNKYGIGP